MRLRWVWNSSPIAFELHAGAVLLLLMLVGGTACGVHGAVRWWLRYGRVAG